MSSVFVLGSTGAVGYEVSLAFLNNGFKVYGLVRNQEKAINLMKNEITPIFGQATDVDSWGPIAEQVDVVIEAIADHSNPSTSEIIFNKLKEISLKRPNLTVIYTSGALTYGNRVGQEIHTEESPYVNYCTLIGLKIKNEELYRSINAIIIQPAFLYGRRGYASSLYFRNTANAVNTSGEVSLFGNEGQVRSFIHGIDLGKFYVLAALKGKSILGGQVLIASSEYFKTEDIVRAIGKVANIDIKSVKYMQPTDGNPYSILFSASSALSSAKARNLLGWKPTQPSLLDDTNRYYLAWKLSNEK